MDFAILGYIGIGVIISSIINAVGNYYIEKQRIKRDTDKWIKDKKMEAYTKISRIMLSLNIISEDMSNPYKIRAEFANVYLICNDNSIKKKLEKYIIKTDELLSNTNNNNQKKLYDELYSDTYEMVQLLGEDLRRI